MAWKFLPLALALSLAAGCTMHSADVSRHAPQQSFAQGTTGTTLVTAETIDTLVMRYSDIYLVGRGDVLQIHAVDAPELTRPSGYVVEADGTIHVPFLGAVQAADRDTTRIRAEITQRLRQYLPQPQVDVRILEYNARHITVIGDVARPNRQTLTTTPLTVIDAINAAGGFLPRANMRGVSILRNGQTIPVDMTGFLSQGAALPTLRDGDVVQVARPVPGRQAAAPVGVELQILGQPPRLFGLGPRDVTVAQIMASAGLNGQAVQLLRDTGPGQRSYGFAPGAASNPAIGGRFNVQNGDRLAVQMTSQPVAHLPN